MAQSTDPLAAMLRQAAEFRDERDWRQFHTPKELAINLCVESAELLALMQWHTGDALNRQVSARRQDIEDELSDVLHSVLLLADELKIDLPAAFSRKMQKNREKYPVERARGSARKYSELAGEAPPST